MMNFFLFFFVIALRPKKGILDKSPLVSNVLLFVGLQILVAYDDIVYIWVYVVWSYFRVVVSPKEIRATLFGFFDFPMLLFEEQYVFP